MTTWRNTNAYSDGSDNQGGGGRSRAACYPKRLPLRLQKTINIVFTVRDIYPTQKWISQQTACGVWKAGSGAKKPKNKKNAGGGFFFKGVALKKQNASTTAAHRRGDDLLPPRDAHTTKPRHEPRESGWALDLRGSQRWLDNNNYYYCCG